MSPRAAILAPGFDAHTGGVERFSVLLQGVLSRLGWDTVAVSPRARPPRWSGRIGLDPFIVAKDLAGQVRTLNPELTITNGFLAAGMVRAKPRIQVFHGTMVGHVLIGEPHRAPHDKARRVASTGIAEALSLRGATVVAVSASAAEEVRRYYRCGHVVTIENGVDIGVFAPLDVSLARQQLGLDPEPSRPYALFVGRFEVRKGADLVEEACARAGFQLVVAGPSAPQSAIALGNLDVERLRLAYSAASCLVFPTRYEACSFVLLEALASGLPAVTTEVGWARTLVEREPSYRALICQPTSEGLAEVMGRVTTPASQTAARRASAHVRRENSLDVFAGRWTQLVRQAVS